MPAIKQGSFVLVTGASGYLASHVVECLLDRGYSVRGTVRSQDKGEYLTNLFKEKKAKFEYVIVEDIAKEGAFDEAVKGVDAVEHTASPFHFQADDPNELFEPAVKGTVGVLKSLQTHNPNAKRVVVTSSVASIMDARKKPPVRFTEKDWNVASKAECDEKGREANNQDKYRASKTLAEEAFWKFFKEESPSFDGAAINPPLILGPIIHQCDKAGSLNTSVAGFYSWMKGEKTEKDLPATGYNWVDVRDCALGHVRALEVEEAAGERFITGAGPTSGNEYCVILHKIFPDIKNVPEGDPSKNEELNSGSNVFDGSKCNKVLGVQYRSTDECFGDMAKSLKERFGL